MIVVVVLAVGAVTIAAAASLWILHKDYLPLLDELERAKQTMDAMKRNEAAWERDGWEGPAVPEEEEESP